MGLSSVSKEAVVTHVTASQYAARHTYCVTLTEVQRALRDTLKRQPDYVIKDKNRAAVCDHPEDGLCLGAAGGDVTPAQLEEVNKRLAARVDKPEQPAQPKQPRAAVSERKTPTEEPRQPKRGLPQGLKDYLARKRAQKENA